MNSNYNIVYLCKADVHITHESILLFAVFGGNKVHIFYCVKYV